MRPLVDRGQVGLRLRQEFTDEIPPVNLARDLADQGQNPFQLDSKAPSIALKDYIYNEVRYRMLSHSAPEEAARLLKLGQEDVQRRWKLYEEMAGRGSAPAQG